MAKQKKRGLVFVPARPDELQIDLDRPRARIPKRLLRLVSEHVQIKSVKYNRSKSGNTHVTIRIKPDYYWSKLLQRHPYNPRVEKCQQFEHLFLQAVLGSDPVRELLSWGRARNGCPYPTLFFEKESKCPNSKTEHTLMTEENVILMHKRRKREV